jgi:hypothetical protein
MEAQPAGVTFKIPAAGHYERSSSMNFSLTGFSQSANLRLFDFHCIDVDRKRQFFTVGVDLTLARQYAISLQDLPLLCRQFLEEQVVGELHSLTFSEHEMLGVANRRAEAKREAALKPKHTRPQAGKAGTAYSGEVSQRFR